MSPERPRSGVGPRGWWPVFLVIAALVMPGPARSGPEPPPVLPAPTFASTVSREISIPMDDGVRLGATVTFPSEDGRTAAPGRFPVVLSITPYGRSGACGCPDRTVFAVRGMIAATADTRGTGGSEGNLNENYFSPREARDGYELVEYFGTQGYSSGRVGMAGGSYVGITQLLAAAQQPPHLSAIVPAAALSDLYRDGFTHGGVPNAFFSTQYIAVQGGPGLAGVNTSPDLAAQTVAGKIQQLAGTPIAFDYLERPNDDQWYRDRSPIYQADRIQVPVLLLGGWRDGLSRGTVEMYNALARRPGVETRLVMDPCTHKGCGAPFAPFTNAPGRDDVFGTVFEFLSRYLLDTPTPARSNVRFSLQEGDRSVDADRWPPSTTEMVRLYLDGEALTPDTPSDAGSRSYFTNPAAGLSMTFDMYGTVAITPYVPTDQRLESRQGLTYRTAALAEPMTLTGPLSLHLVAASTATDTDWIVKVADVAPDGSESIITNGYLRASHREVDAARSRVGVPYHTHTNPTPIEPGTPHAYEVEVWPTAYELSAGHRLQIRVTSYDVPTHGPASVRFDRTDPASTAIVPMLPATNSILHGGADPSFLLIPLARGTE